MSINRNKYYSDYYEQKIYNTNCGPCKILKYVNSANVFIIFLSTNFTRWTRIKSVIDGDVKDYRHPSRYNIGFLGDDYPFIKKTYKDIYKRLSNIWSDILSNIYNKESDAYAYYKYYNITIDKRWLNFSNFFWDALSLEGWDKTKFINKEIVLSKNKILFHSKQCHMLYSKDTCCWIPNDEKMKYVRNKVFFEVIHPDGHKTFEDDIESFSKVCNIKNTDLRYYIRKNGSINGYAFIKLNKEGDKNI